MTPSSPFALFRALTFRQVMGVELIWLVSLGIVFVFTLWLRVGVGSPEADPGGNAVRVGIEWNWDPIGLVVLGPLLLLPVILWSVVRVRAAKESTSSPSEGKSAKGPRRDRPSDGQ